MLGIASMYLIYFLTRSLPHLPAFIQPPPPSPPSTFKRRDKKSLGGFTKFMHKDGRAACPLPTHLAGSVPTYRKLTMSLQGWAFQWLMLFWEAGTTRHDCCKKWVVTWVRGNQTWVSISIRGQTVNKFRSQGPSPRDPKLHKYGVTWSATCCCCFVLCFRLFR